jgi:predicted NBD/HSP70 family sugar kinase
MLSLNANMVIVVADIRPTQSIVAVVDLNGRFLNLETVPLYKDPARGVEKIITAMQRMIKEFPERSFEGIGLSLPGRVDPDSQHLSFAPNLPWCDFDIKGAIEAKIHLQVEMDNAANACLLSELWFGNMDGVRNAVLVTITEGIGTAILANGQLVTGTNGLAGEFGHMCIDRSGPLCGCGRKGCWEMFGSSRAAINFYCDLKPNAERPDIISLLNLAADGDAFAIEALSRQAKFLAHGLLTIITALAPEVIHLNGGLTSLWDRFGPIVAEELANSILAGKPPRLAVTSDVELSRLRGAAALVLQRHSGSRRIAGGVAATKSSKRRNPVSAHA